MNTITQKDSELYDLFLEVCDELGYDQYMPEPGCLLTNAKGDNSMTAWATSFKIKEPFKAGDDIKTYLKEGIEAELKFNSNYSFYPYSLRKSDDSTKIILRGAIQEKGWTTLYNERDRKFNKSILDKVEDKA
jgi:hypothetical protein